MYFVRLRGADGKRLTKSLETRDAVVAAKRAHEALEVLQSLVDGPSQQRWRADEPGVMWDIPSKPDGTNDYANAVAIPITAAEVLEPHQLKGTEWRDLVNEAIAVRKRKKGGADYSPAWYTNTRIALDKVPFQFEEATPKAIRAWMHSMQAEGLGGRSIEMHCGVFRSLITTCIRSGMLEGHSNPFSLVDFGSDPDEVQHIYTAVESDYRGLKALLPKLPQRERLPILLQAYCGTRISELQRRKREDFDFEACTMSVVRDLEKGQRVKNKHSIRTVPLPAWLCKELRDWDMDWPCTNQVNKKTKLLNPELTSHSFRHGLIRVNRDLGGEPTVIEAATGHKVGKTVRSEMAATYGDGFSIDSMRTAMTPIWERLDSWMH